jgi:hypothetical protein
VPTYNPQAAYNLYYDPNSSYGGQYAPGEWATTPIGGGNWNSYLETPANRDAAFLRYLGEIGGPTQEWGNPNAPKGAWARQQFGNTVTGYEAALATNPLLKYQDYLGGIDMDSIYNALTPQQQGKNPGMFAGRMRTIGRF